MGTRLLKPGYDILGAEYQLAWENLDISMTLAGMQSAECEAQLPTVCLEAGLAALLEFARTGRDACRNI
jgi:hypothetical protein